MKAMRLLALGGLSPAGTFEEIKAGRNRAAWPPGPSGANVCDPARLKDLPALYPGVQLRRAPRLARLALRAAAELGPETAAPENRALVLVTAYASVSSTFEFLDSLLDDGPSLASPTAFSHSVTNMCAALLSRNLDIQGPTLTLTQNRFFPALEAAAVLLEAGRAETVLLGAFGEYSGLMREIEQLARPGGPPPLADGAFFFRLGRGATENAGAALEFDASADPDQGPLAQAWRLATMLEQKPMTLTINGRDGGRAAIQYQEP